MLHPPQRSTRRIMLLIVFAVFMLTVFETPERYLGYLGKIWDAVSSIALGFGIAFILNLLLVPIERLLSRLRFLKGKLLRSAGIVLTLTVTVGVLALMLGTVIPCIVQIVESVIDKLTGDPVSIGEKLGELIARLGLTDERLQEVRGLIMSAAKALRDYLTEGVSSYASGVFSFTAGVFGSIIDIILVLAVAIYTLASKEALIAAVKKLMRAYLPQRAQQVLLDLGSLMYDKFSKFFRGQIIEAVLLGLMCFAGMLIFRFPNAGTISILMGVSSIVPVLGPWVGSITSILLTLLTNPLQGVFYAIFILTLQQVEDNVLYPRIVGKSMDAPGLLVLSAVIIGAAVGGMPGIVLGVPMGAVIYELVKKRIEPNSD